LARDVLIGAAALSVGPMPPIHPKTLLPSC
jgi:hypothetical protein